MFLSSHAASFIYSVSTAQQQEDDITQCLSNESRCEAPALLDDEREKHAVLSNRAGDMTNGLTSQLDT